MQRITLELDDETVEALDSLARRYLEHTNMNLLQWINQTTEGRAYWTELNNNKALLLSSSTRELNALLMRRFREYCPSVMGRPAIAKARGAALKELLLPDEQAAA